jgi:xylose dehydrogenase (NAD/NADP)
MIEAGRRNNVILAEAFACMHSPLYPTVRQLIADGVIGDIRVVNSYFGCPVPEIPGSIHYSKAMGAGSVLNVGSYNILTIRELTGREPRQVKAVGRLDAQGSAGIDLSHYVVMEMGDGIMAVAEGSHDTAIHRGFEVLGTKGFLSFNRTPNAWGELNINYTNQQGSFTRTVDAPNTYGQELQQFGTCILDQEKPTMSLESSLANTRIYEQILKEIGLPV